MWMLVIGAAVAFVIYTYWKQNQIAPRVPVASGAAAGAGGTPGLLDSVAGTVKKLSGIFGDLVGRPAVAPAAAPVASGYGEAVTWI